MFGEFFEAQSVQILDQSGRSLGFFKANRQADRAFVQVPADLLEPCSQIKLVFSNLEKYRFPRQKLTITRGMMMVPDCLEVRLC
ncbi:hypothetical protein [Salinimonas sediminis]|uniref:Uncharacterized protein n=1 Tax=Salinimonas sediminis TaxID=2303538 RepID=A0A346NLA4_9ALTE|nr:hypothetical protein [Salinimonas sediminis]AXR06311.1 hypothetical protein D0Y50_08010 [Salinimonas sediminis]